ncbi:MAG: hypothetical protein ACRC5T_02310, partial [Cetobacterium sp.]
MKNLASVEKFLKRCFKEKVTVTTATMVAFLITGSLGYGAVVDISGVNQEIKEVLEGDYLNITNSTINFTGEIKTDQTAVILSNITGDNIFTNNGVIIAENGIMIANEGFDQSPGNKNLVKMKNGKNGKIEAKVFGMSNNGYYTKYNPTEILNEGEILINDYVNTCSGDKPYIYSNGIYSANRPDAVKGHVKNTGNITVEMNEEKNSKAKSLYEESKGNMFANIQGIRLHENTEGFNSGKILIKTHTGVGVALTAGDTGANEMQDYGSFQNNGTIETIGDYTIGVQLKNSTTAKLTSLNDTDGVIKITGKNSIGIKAIGNSEATNNGTIALNVFGE